MLLHHDHKAVVYALAFSPDGGTLASGDKNGSLLLRDTDGRVQQICEPGLKTPAIHAIAHLPNGGVVIGHAHGWYVYGRDAAMSSTAPTTALALIDANTVAVGTGDRVKGMAGTLELWDLSAGRRRGPVFREPNGVRAVATCRAKRLVAWATGHMKINVWDTSRQTPTQFPLTRHCPAVALSPDGSQLAAAVDWTIRIYDIAKKRERLMLKGHKGQVTSLAFSPDGSTLATGGCDVAGGVVKLWDVASGNERQSFQWPIGRVYSLTYAPDGFRLAAGGDLGAVVVWDAE